MKESAREKRDEGQRRKVTSETKLPSKWKMFLQDTTNKEELFSLLTEKVKDFQFPENKDVNITSGENVFSSSKSSDMQRCDHEEADTRIAVHVLHALNKGHNQVLIRTLDTDVVVVMMGFSTNCYLYIPLQSLGMGKRFELISVSAIL